MEKYRMFKTKKIRINLHYSDFLIIKTVALMTSTKQVANLYLNLIPTYMNNLHQ